MSSRLSVIISAAVLAAIAGAAAAQDKPHFGKPISEADIAPWNIDIRTPDGKGLPAGRGTAAEGEKIYNAKCLACHGPKAAGGSVYGSMVGGIGSFKTEKRVLTPGSMYPYAPILFDYIRRAMPMDHPQSLTTNEIYPNGISTSLPFDVQLELVHTIRGLENAHLLRPGYAIEKWSKLC